MSTIEFCAFSTRYADVTIAAHEDHEILISNGSRSKVANKKSFEMEDPANMSAKFFAIKRLSSQ